MDIQSQRNLVVSYYLTKNKMPYDLIQYIMSLVINSDCEYNCTLNLPLSNYRLPNNDECYIIDDKWIQMYGSPYDLLSNILPPSQNFDEKNKSSDEYAVRFTKRKNGTFRPKLSKYAIDQTAKNLFFKPDHKQKNETDVLLFFKYQTNHTSLPIFLFSMWVDIKHDPPINESIFDREIRKRHFQSGKKLYMYEHVRFDSQWVFKVKNSTSFFEKNDIGTGDIIILSYADNLNTHSYHKTNKSTKII